VKIRAWQFGTVFWHLSLSLAVNFEPAIILVKGTRQCAVFWLYKCDRELAPWMRREFAIFHKEVWCDFFVVFDRATAFRLSSPTCTYWRYASVGL